MCSTTRQSDHYHLPAGVFRLLFLFPSRLACCRDRSSQPIGSRRHLEAPGSCQPRTGPAAPRSLSHGSCRIPPELVGDPPGGRRSSLGAPVGPAGGTHHLPRQDEGVLEHGSPGCRSAGRATGELPACHLSRCLHFMHHPVKNHRGRMRQCLRLALLAAAQLAGREVHQLYFISHGACRLCTIQ